MDHEINFTLYTVFIVTLSCFKSAYFLILWILLTGLLLFWFLHNSYIRNLLVYSYLLVKILLSHNG